MSPASNALYERLTATVVLPSVLPSVLPTIAPTISPTTMAAAVCNGFTARSGTHTPILETTWVWADEAACAAQADQLSRCPGLCNAFIELHGPLGAGKTTFVRHLLRAMGVQGRIKSPTYTVLESYAAGPQNKTLTISHCDFYRFADPREWAEAGLRDVFMEPGLKLVEWADKASGMLPQPDLRLHIEPVDPVETTDSIETSAPTDPLRADERRVLAQAFTARGVEMLS